MYESPIEIIQGEMRTEFENGILRAVQKYDIHCNKEELIKALAYDRNQYQKGYEDGRPKWIPCSERLPDTDEIMLVTAKPKKGAPNVNRAYYSDGFWHGSESMTNITAWMPLPEPYKEDLTC